MIDGHLDSTNGPALFLDLHLLRAGDKVYVLDAAGQQLSFTVTGVALEPRNGFPTMKVFGPAAGAGLNLITCAGHFDAGQRTYDHRLVVFTRLDRLAA